MKTEIQIGRPRYYPDRYVNEIYTQRHLTKWVYRGEDYTMILVDTHVDRNQFLQIFANKYERPDYAN